MLYVFFLDIECLLAGLLTPTFFAATARRRHGPNSWFRTEPTLAAANAEFFPCLCPLRLSRGTEPLKHVRRGCKDDRRETQREDPAQPYEVAWHQPVVYRRGRLPGHCYWSDIERQ